MRGVCLGVLLVVVGVVGVARAVLADNGAAGLRAGAAKRSLVPPFPTQLAGYYDRTEPFSGVHAPLYARALVFDNGETALAVVGVDLLCVSREIVEPAREAIEAATGIPVDHVLICAGHIHSAPSGFCGGSMFTSPVDDRVVAFLVEQIVGAATDAHAALQPAVIGYGAGHLDTISRNRQRHNDTLDPEVGVLRVQAASSRKVIATLFNFAGHPVIQNEHNLEIDGGYPGHAASTVESVLGGVALFTQGACGNVTMIRSGSSFDEIARIGNVLAGEVIKTAESIRPQSTETPLMSVYQPVEVTARRFPPTAEAKAAEDTARKAYDDGKAQGIDEVALRQLERELDDAEWAHRLAAYTEANPEVYESARHASVQVVQIGPLVLVGVPGELFVEYGLEMKQRVRAMAKRPMMLVGFANDYLGYLVTPRAIAVGGYEQASARVDENAGRTLTEAAMAIVETQIK